MLGDFLGGGVTRGDRILVAVEFGFALPLAVAYLVLCLQLPSTVLFGIADGANQLVGSALGLSPQSARWRPEGYWFQEGLLTLLAASAVYPLTARRSAVLLGVAGIAMPLTATGLLVAADASSRAWSFAILGWVTFAWVFGGLTAWGLPRERNVVDRRVLVGGTSVVLMVCASLLADMHSLFIGVSTWGATLLGLVAWGRWIVLTGCVRRS